MITAVEKLFELILPDGHCECCGMTCKTALCQSCKEDLQQEMDNNHFYIDEGINEDESALTS